MFASPRRVLPLILLLAGMALIPHGARAQGAMASELDAVSAELELLAAENPYNVALEEISQVRGWIQRANGSMVAAPEEAKKYLRWSKLQVELIQLMMEETAVRKTLDETRDKLAMAEARADEAEAARDAARSKMEKLESEGY